MTLDTFRTALDIFVLMVALPATGYKIWRKLDERLTASDTKLAKIEYALFNDGRGIEQQIKEMYNNQKDIYTNQQNIMTDIAVLKAVQHS